MALRNRIVAVLFTGVSTVFTVSALAQEAPTAPENPYTPPACTGIFSDVPCPGGFAVNWIEKFANDGITSGCATNPLRYCPGAPVTRAQMAVFVEEAMHGTGSWTPGDLGNFSTGIGANSLPFSATGGNNTAVGDLSLHADTTGFGNTAVGASSLAANTTGVSNIAVGMSSLQANTTGGENIAVGWLAMELNTTASENTAIGYQALQAQSYDPGTGPWNSFNTAVGAFALMSNQPNGGVNGTGNTAVGADSLSGNTTGYWNTAVGENSLQFVTTGFDNTAFGWKAGARGGDTITGYGGTPVVFVSDTTGSYNTFLGISGATAQVDNCTAVGTDAYCDATNEVRLGNFYVSAIGGKVGWSALSDARVKTDIADLDLGLDFVMALHPVSFRYKGGNGRTDMGLVAQDVEAVLGDTYNVLGIGGDKDRTLSLRYTDFIAPMVKAIQEQQATITSQQAQIDELKAQVQALLAAQRHGDANAQP